MQPIGPVFYVDTYQMGHARRRSSFVLPSVLRPDCHLCIERMDLLDRGLSQSDVHMLVHAQLRPGQSVVMRNYINRPPSQFRITMVQTPDARAAQA